MSQEGSTVKVNKNRRKPKNQSSRNPPKGQTSKKVENVENSQKFLQIGKLIRSFKPVTVNGIPSWKIAESVKARETKVNNIATDSATGALPAQMNARDKTKYVKQYILEFIQKQPDSTVHLSFIVKPSDPDFPFDLEDLKVSLSIPAKYPYDGQIPSIVVLNEEIPRGFAINLEQGFKRICKVALTNARDEDINMDSKKSLVAQVEALDKYLELFLKQEKKLIVKIVLAKTPKPEKKSVLPSPEPKPEPARIDIPRDVLERRNQMLERLIYRFGSNVKLFKKSTTENRYKITIPIQPQQVNIPELWKLNKSIDLMVGVPVNYPEEGLSFSFPNNFNTNLILKYKKLDTQVGGSKDEPQQKLLDYTRTYKAIEKIFISNISKDKFGGNLELVGTLNWIANNLGVFCYEEKEFDQWEVNLNKFRIGLTEVPGAIEAVPVGITA